MTPAMSTPRTARSRRSAASAYHAPPRSIDLAAIKTNTAEAPSRTRTFRATTRTRASGLTAAKSY
jgi:hypothetical protein